jgi:hypothetical protein
VVFPSVTPPARGHRLIEVGLIRVVPLRDECGRRVGKLLQRKTAKQAAIALANRMAQIVWPEPHSPNRMARTVWAFLRNGADYDASRAA